MSSTQSRAITIPLKTLVLLLCVFALLWALSQIQAALLILYISTLIAVALHPMIQWLTARRIPKVVSIAGVFAIFLLLIGLLIFTLGSIFISQGQQLVAHFPHYLDLATHQVKRLPFINTQQTDWLQNANVQLGAALQKNSVVLISSVGYLLGAIGSVFSIFTILIFSFFFLVETDYFNHVLSMSLPVRDRERTLGLVSTILKEIGGYVRGQFAVATITGLIIAIALSLIDVPFSYLQGIIMAILDIIPVVGPLIAMSIGIVITLGVKMSMVPWVIVIYIGAQQLENAFIFPFIMNRSVKLHGFWILLSIFLTGALVGGAGIILAVPLAITLKAVISEYYLKRLESADIAEA